MSGFLIVSFFTTDTPYVEVMREHLGASVERLGVPHRLYAVEPQGSWRKNVSLKPSVILRALEEHPEQDVVFIDADGTLETYPALFDAVPDEYDIAAHYLNWNDWYGYTDDPPTLELLSGTMFFRNTAGVKSLVRQWHADTMISGHREREQKILQRLLQPERVYRLPLAYCWIATLPNGTPPRAARPDPVVVSHAQVSRHLHAVVNAIQEPA